jgi:hypothetical protein
LRALDAFDRFAEDQHKNFCHGFSRITNECHP